MGSGGGSDIVARREQRRVDHASQAIRVDTAAAGHKDHGLLDIPTASGTDQGRDFNGMDVPRRILMPGLGNLQVGYDPVDET